MREAVVVVPRSPEHSPVEPLLGCLGCPAAAAESESPSESSSLLLRVLLRVLLRSPAPPGPCLRRAARLHAQPAAAKGMLCRRECCAARRPLLAKPRNAYPAPESEDRGAGLQNASEPKREKWFHRSSTHRGTACRDDPLDVDAIFAGTSAQSAHEGTTRTLCSCPPRCSSTTSAAATASRSFTSTAERTASAHGSGTPCHDVRHVTRVPPVAGPRQCTASPCRPPGRTRGGSTPTCARSAVRREQAARARDVLMDRTSARRALDGDRDGHR